MRWVAVLVFGITLFQSTAFADVLRFKSGKTKTGRILAESKEHILFQDIDGALCEIVPSDISILDRGNVSGNGGHVSFYSTSPRKKKKPTPKHPQIIGATNGFSGTPPTSVPTGMDSQGTSLSDLKKRLDLWLERYPESREWLESATKDDSLKSIDMEWALAEIEKQS